MNFLKKRPFRAILILLIAVLTSVCCFIVYCCFIETDYTESIERQESYHYIHSSLYEYEINELYDKLWIIGNMYLANRSDDGEYIVNEYIQKGIEDYLRAHELMDDNGNIIISDYPRLEYIVSYGDNIITNTDKTLSELQQSKYGVLLDGYTFDYDSSFGYSYHDFDEYMDCFATNYGKLVYTIDGRRISFYPFDTEGLGYYYYTLEDYSNEKNYYKLDGSTPLPPQEATLYTDSRVFFIHSDGDPELELNEILLELEGFEDDRGAEIFYVDDNEYDDYFGMAGITTRVYDLENHKWINAVTEETTSLMNKVTVCIAPDDASELEYEEYQQSEVELGKYYIKQIIVFAMFVMVIFAFVLMYFVYCGYDNESAGYRLTFFDRIYTEVIVAALVALGFGVAFYVGSVLSSLYSASDMLEIFRERFILAAYTGGLGIMAAVAAILLGSVVNRLKCHKFIETTLVLKLIRLAVRKIKSVYYSFGRVSHTAFFKRHILRYVIGAVTVFVTSLAIGDAANDGEAFVIAWLLLTALYAAYVYSDLRDAKEIAELSRRIESIREGDYSSEQLNEKAVTYKMQEDLNSISSGVSKVVDEQIRSERMKIDLVTNVSHDLKTPLTSIISYVDLLSKEDLPDEAMDYVKVLVNKTQRLKAIISDLFDLAKATSETDMQLEELDAVILVRQVLADMEDKIDRFGRDIRTDIQPESVKVIGEGKKLYRIVQNVIDNALKYSLENTRIYLTLSQTDTHAVITVKNIASYEMDFTGDEIVERFARGDKSRTSEGNGLGLSIAKSFAQACGGSFEVTPEGDVFTAEIRLKKTEKSK